MSLRHAQDEVPRPVPVVYDPLPSPAEEFRDAHNGSHAGPVRDRPPRPFHPTKCAHSGADVVRLASAGRADAAEFVEALLDVVEDNTRVRPFASMLEFVVNTGTPSQHQGWVYSVRMTAPINAAIKMVRGADGAWEYAIERSTQRTRPRSSTDRPLHPRRHQDPAAGRPQPPEGYFLQDPDPPLEEHVRNVDI